MGELKKWDADKVSSLNQHSQGYKNKNQEKMKR